MPSFPLATAGWIPVLTLAGDYVEVCLGEALARAHELRLAADAHEHAVLLRVLLAAFDAAAGPTTLAEWAQAWDAPTLDAARIDAYLTAWGHRLDLLHPARPAFQAGGLTDCPRPAAALRHAFLGGTSGAWFNRAALNDAKPLPAGEAARLLLTRLGYDIAGIKSGVKGVTGDKTFGAHLGPLGGVTHLSVGGATLKEELLLNLPPQPRADGDRPAWEAADDLPLTPGATRRVLGRLDWWTWPGRLMRLRANEDGEVEAFAWHDGLRPERSGFTTARAHDPLTAWRTPTQPLDVADEFHQAPAWVGGRVALAEDGVMAHLRTLCEANLLPHEYPLRVVVTWADYNSHKTSLQHEGTGMGALVSAELFADPAVRRLLASAAHFAHSVPHAIRRVAAGGHERQPRPLRVGHLALQPTRAPWGRFLQGVADGQRQQALLAWRGAVVKEAFQVARHQVRGSVLDRGRFEDALAAYLYSIPLDALPPEPQATPAGTSKSRAGRPRQEHRAFGEAKTLAEWVADPRCQVSLPTLRARLAAGEPLEQAISRKPARGRAATTRKDAP